MKISTTIQPALRALRWAFVLPLLLAAHAAWGQCTNTEIFPSSPTAINTSGAAVQITACSFAGEYSAISGAVSGQTLRFTSSVSTDYITVRSGTSNGPVLAQGTTPLQFSNTFTGTVFAHWNTNAACGAQSTCRATTVQCTSCSAPAFDPCASIGSLSCGTSATITLVGTGAWSNNACGFGTPGQEKLGSALNLVIA
jgi:hypothetical protein